MIRFFLVYMVIGFMTVNVEEAAPTFDNVAADGSTRVSLVENTALNSVVYTLKATDPGGNALTYDINPANPAFIIKAGTQEIRVDATIDYEAQQSYTLDVSVTDGTDEVFGVVTIDIIDVNDNNPVISGTLSVAIDEEQVVGTTVPFAITVTDGDASDTTAYSLSGLHSNYFLIQSTSGEITVGKRLDRDATSAITVFDQLLLTVTDGGGNTGTATLTVTLNDINDNSPICNPSSYFKTIVENSVVNTPVVIITCTDADAGNNGAITLSIFSGDDAAAKFSITGGAIETTAIPVDYESLSAQSYQYNLVIHAVDDGIIKKTGTATVVVSISPQNEHSPIWAAFTPAYVVGVNYNILESIPVGTNVVTIAATDADEGVDGTVTFDLISVADDTGTTQNGVFNLDTTTGVLSTLKLLDADTATGGVVFYDVSVRAKDGGSPPQSIDRIVTLELTDVNDIAPVFGSNSYSVTILETLATGGSVVQTLATDKDATPTTLTYAILAGDSLNLFTFSTTTAGLLELQRVVDLDPPSSLANIYTLRIGASDGTLSGTASVTVIVVPVNEFTPVFGTTDPSNTVQITEDTTVGTSVAKVVATDSDYGDHGKITFSITAGNTNTAFTVDSTLGVIKTMTSLDFETTTVYLLEVTATDGGNPANFATTTVTVSITNVNENAPTCTSYDVVATIAENAAVNAPVTSLTCSDADTADVLAYSITNGNIGNAFALDAATGSLSLANVIDYETLTSYTLLIDVIDQATPVKTTSATIKVLISPVNEHNPVFPAGGYSTTVPENGVIGSIVVTVTATDADTGNSHGTPRYSIIGGDSLGQFLIGATSGQITIANDLDREAISSYTLTVHATDSVPGATDQRSADTQVTITVTDVNDSPPVFTPTTYIRYVLESAATGSTVATLTSTDDDTGANAVPTYSIQSDPSSFFQISGNTLVLIGTLDYETVTSHTVLVHATDGGTPQLTGTATVVINVLPANDNAPVFTDPNGSAVISETTPVGTNIYNATATDSDIGTGGKVSYYIISGNGPSNTTFYINPTQGVTYVWSILDYDTSPQIYNLTLKAEDSGGLFDTMWLYITLTDENDEYPVFTQNTYNAAINEDVTIGTSVAQIVANDADSGVNGQVRYSIVSGDGQTSFTIEPSTGVINTQIILDHEVKTLYYLVVQAVDGGNPALTSSSLVKVSINDINDNPPIFSPADFTVNILEDVPVGTSVTTVNAKDADSAANSNNIFTYSLTDNFFGVNGANGVISTKALVDRETQASHILFVKAVDQGTPSLTGTATVTVELIDVNDNAPVITGNYDRTVPEDTSVGIILFTIAATDADDKENGRITFSLVGGNIGGDFKIDADAGFVQINNALDRERTPSYALQIRAADNGLPPKFTDITVTITIGDINDNDPIFTGTPYMFNIAENEAAGTLAGTLAAIDADEGVNAKLMYYLSNFWTGDSTHFTVDGIAGEVKSTVILDRELIAEYFVRCKVQDGGNPPRSTFTNATITITDVNDNFPTFDSFTYSATTPENSAVGTNVLAVTVTDNDIGINKDFTLSIDTSTAGGVLADNYLSIDTPTQILSVKTVIDRETVPNFSFFLKAIDKGTPALTSSASVSITVLDLNDNAPIFNPFFYNSEVSYAGQCTNNILTVSATDLDVGANGEVIYYLVQSTYDHLFNMDATSGLLTLKSTASTNFNYILTSNARDNGIPSQISATAATLRIDTFTPNEIIITFNLKISRADFLAKQTEFLVEVANLMRVKYPNAQSRIWCIEERSGTAITPPARRRLLAINPVSVHVYALTDNSTDSITNRNRGKTFLTYDQALSFFTTDPNGSPSSAVTGPNWNYYSVGTVTPYQEQTTAWHETPTGIAVITIICLVLVFLLALCIYLCIRRYRQRQRPIKPTRAQLVDKKSKMKNGEIPDLDQDLKKHPPPAILSLPMVTKSKTVPVKTYDEDFFWGGQIAPLSTAGTRLQTMTPLPLEDDAPSYRISNRNFDGMAVDPGNLYEYNTKTNATRWINTPDGKTARVSNLLA